MNMKLEEQWLWVKTVIRSCTSYKELKVCPRLVSIFWKNNHIPLRLTMSDDEIKINKKLSIMVDDLNDEIIKIPRGWLDEQLKEIRDEQQKTN